MRGKDEGLPLAALLVTYTIWGFSFMFTSMAMDVSAPEPMLAWRFTLAFALINLVMLITPRFRFSMRGLNVWPLLLLGLMEPVIYFVCESYGILLTTTAFSGVMIALIPVVIMALSSVFLKERPTLKQALFCLASICGVVVMALQGGSEGTLQPLGVLFLGGAVLSAAAFGILSRGLSRRYNTFQRTYFALGESMVFFWAFALIKCGGRYSELIAPLTEPIFGVSMLYLGGLSSVLGYLLLNYAIGRLPAVRTAVFTNLTTVISILAGAVFLKESFTILSALCSVVILAGIWGVQKSALVSTEQKS